MSSQNFRKNMNTDPAEKKFQIPIPPPPPLPKPMPRGLQRQTTENTDHDNPDDVSTTTSEITSTTNNTDCPHTPNVSTCKHPCAPQQQQQPKSGLPLGSDQKTPITVRPCSCQNSNWVVTPDKETYRTVLVNYHFQNCQTGGACCRHAATTSAAHVGKCQCPESTCCTRRNRERRDVEPITKNLKEEDRAAADGKYTSFTRTGSPDPQGTCRKAAPTRTNHCVQKKNLSMMVDEEGNVFENDTEAANVDEDLEGAVGGGEISFEGVDETRDAENDQNSNERSRRAKAISKRNEVLKQQQMELHRCRISVELRKLELLAMKIDRERQEMERAKILFERQMEVKSHVELNFGDEDV